MRSDNIKKGFGPYYAPAKLRRADIRITEASKNGELR